MLVSLNTNTVAMRTLQDVNATQSRLNMIQNRISTGKVVASAKDNGALFGMAQGQRADIASIGRVLQSLDRGLSTAEVAMAAASEISDLLITMKEKALAASDRGLDSTSRAALNEDFKALRDQISKVVANASFNGANLVNGSLANGYIAIANENGGTVTIRGENLSLGGSLITVAATESLGTATLSATAVSAIETSVNALSSALARLGAGVKGFERNRALMSRIVDALEVGVSSLVDADMSKESARLQAEQVKLQLGYQNLSSANQASQGILSLFKG